MYYAYCPECGTEAHFLKEPSETHKIKCDYCGNVFYRKKPPKTRWKKMAVIALSVFLSITAILVFAIVADAMK